ncbi:uncharacterized protein EV420DRAFT_887125 [Desarmillaria tabescens]|uniref:Uncharacterized protein n=1 Tax=Armillaria tabescens TaxID=1929756 RepID=A0AA39MUZ9_ARMTA|nr:uncharacterized protein EV420DRAFT_887125 [Desarmillaria tabescens]KAK0447034.1 hypothetical protein EV420DRAFT_887125 [Desarmillaria tabescens]
MSRKSPAGKGFLVSALPYDTPNMTEVARAIIILNTRLGREPVGRSETTSAVPLRCPTVECGLISITVLRLLQETASEAQEPGPPLGTSRYSSINRHPSIAINNKNTPFAGDVLISEMHAESWPLRCPTLPLNYPSVPMHSTLPRVEAYTLPGCFAVIIIIGTFVQSRVVRG